MLEIAFFLVSILHSHCVHASKPLTKRPQEIWHIECQLGIITDPDCPVDGGWSAWSPWSPCRGVCDSMGFKVRNRQCDNPPPSNDGTPCIGNEEETVTCHLTDCTVEDFKHLASGNWPRMEALHQLEVIPALMEQCLLSDCPYEAIQAALSNDNTWSLNPEAVWNSLHCVKQNMGCRVPGEWGAWGAWSSCSARCGKGVRCRLRRCDSPPPSDDKHKCSGNPLETQMCEGEQCAIEDHVFYKNGGTWGEWQPWSDCSESCGPGARRRRRVCEEKSTREIAGTWGTHCQGHHDEIEVCENQKCVLQGGWSGWGMWGQCSKTCGAGKRVRYRTCTRPVPAGGGAPCAGPKIEVDSCHLNPCEVYSHVVAVLNGDSYLHYDFKKKRSTYFHLFIRFLPLSPYGTLVRRGDVRDPLVRLSLQKWRVCVDASGVSKSCNLHRLCSPLVLEPAIWHNALVTITNNEATLRIDDSHDSLRSTFPCNPDLANDNMTIFIGEKFHGEIQEIVLNFIPLGMIRSERSTQSYFFPVSVCNVVFEEGNIEEGFLNMDADHYLRLPCFDDPVEWRLELTVKPKRDSGTLLFLRDEEHNSWLHLSLHNMRVKMQVGFDDFRTETSGSTDYFPNEWLDLVMLKQRCGSTVETSINAGERLHAVLEEENLSVSAGKVKKCNIMNFFKKQNKYPVSRPANKSKANVSYQFCEPVMLPICDDEFFVGSIPNEYKDVVGNSISFTGIIGMIVINGVMQDLHKLSIERSKRDGVQLSSRTASVSGSYHETAWGFSNRLNLTCIHARAGLSPNTAQWLLLDTVIHSMISSKTVRSIDDGRILRLVATANNDPHLLRGFYTCRSHSKRVTRNVVTYGVLGKIPERLTSPDAITAVALVTTLGLIICTLSWILIEALHDIRNGYGFFRDRHLTPQEEAEEICAYIDKNIDLIGSKSAAKIAKARARRKGRQLTSKVSIGVQEPQGMMAELHDSDCSTSKSRLPAIKSSEEHIPQVYRCEPCYVSSPRHGSNLTPRMLTSSSADTNSPRVCPRLLVSRVQKRKRVFGGAKLNSNLLTIKSSTFVNRIAHRILERFQELKTEDS